MIRFLVIAALLFTAFVIGIIVARDDLREDAIKQARSAIVEPGKDGKKTGKKSASPGWMSWFTGDSKDHRKESVKLETPEPAKQQAPRAEPPSLPPVQAPAEYTNPEDRLPVSPAERAQAKQAEKEGHPLVNPDRMKQLEERKAERDRLINMSPEERRAYREEKRKEQTARRAERSARIQQGLQKQPGQDSIEDVLQNNP